MKRWIVERMGPGDIWFRSEHVYPNRVGTRAYILRVESRTWTAHVGQRLLGSFRRLRDAKRAILLRLSGSTLATK